MVKGREALAVAAEEERATARGLGPFAANHPAHLVAGEQRQIAVEDEYVVAHDASFGQCVRAVGGEVDSHPLAAQSACDRGSQPGLILGDQNAHISEDGAAAISTT